MPLRLLLDSADPADWERWLPRGLFFGVTTNPTLLRRAGRPCRTDALADLARRAVSLGAREVHLQAWGEQAEDLTGCGRELAAAAANRVVVKLPVTTKGSEAARRLIAEGVPITFTACYEAHQVLIAAALGARYIAPYLGRICDQGRDGHAELISMQRCLDGLNSEVRLLVASLRDPADLVRLAAAGMDTFTISATVAEALFLSQATREAAARFEADAATDLRESEPPLPG